MLAERTAHVASQACDYKARCRGGPICGASMHGALRLSAGQSATDPERRDHLEQISNCRGLGSAGASRLGDLVNDLELHGVWLIAQGQRAPGPSASIGAAAMLLAFAAAFVVAASRWPVN